MNPELLKAFGRYGAASLIAMYLVYFLTTEVMKGIDQMLVYEGQSIKLLEAILMETEKGNELHRRKYGLKIEDSVIQPAYTSENTL